MSHLITYAEKTRICKDWQEQFPEMCIMRKPMRICKRVGSLMLKISLYVRTPDHPDYNADFAVHPLYRDYPSPGLMALSYHGGNLYWWIDRKPDWYDSTTQESQKEWDDRRERIKNLEQRTDSIHYDGYLRAAEKIKKNSWIKPEGPVSLDDIWEGTERYIAWWHGRNALDLASYDIEMPVYAAIWGGELDKANEYFERLMKWGEKFPQGIGLAGVGTQGRKWRDVIIEAMKDPELLRQTARDQVTKHKLEKVPFQNILGTRHQE